MQLTCFLGVVQQTCPHAVKDVLNNELDIDLDVLDLPAFRKLDKYVGDAVGRRKLRY